MLKALIFTAMALALAACADDDSKKPRRNDNAAQDGQPTPGPVTEPGPAGTVVETDLAVCRNGLNSSALEGKWLAVLRTGDLRMRLTFDFRGTRLTLTNACEIDGTAVASAQVAATIKRQATSFDIVRGGSDTQQATVNGTVVNCSATLEEKQVVGYRFNGSCVDFTLKGETLTTIPGGF